MSAERKGQIRSSSLFFSRAVSQVNVEPVVFPFPVMTPSRNRARDGQCGCCASHTQGLFCQQAFGVRLRLFPAFAKSKEGDSLPLHPQGGGLLFPVNRSSRRHGQYTVLIHQGTHLCCMLCIQCPPSPQRSSSTPLRLRPGALAAQESSLINEN